MGELKDNLIKILKESNFEKFCDPSYGLANCNYVDHNCYVCPFNSDSNLKN